jgi:hypothetical protein
MISLKKDDLQTLLAGFRVMVPDGKGNLKRTPAADWWLHSRHKRHYDLVCYDPENKLASSNLQILNTWTGFAITPDRRGTCRKMVRHLWRVICQRDRKAFK